MQEMIPQIGREKGRYIRRNNFPKIMQKQWKFDPNIVHESWCKKVPNNLTNGDVGTPPTPQEHSNFKDPTEVIHLMKKTSIEK